MQVSSCIACGLTLVKQPIGIDGLPNPKPPSPPKDLPAWKLKGWLKYNSQNHPKIWSCPVHGITPIRKQDNPSEVTK